MNPQKISVIIPTYNRAKCIQGAIDSVLNQTRHVEEIIVVDDGSTDETRSALSGYGDKIKYLYKENGGVSSARNVGVIAATGNWIAFLDSDDLWEHDKIEKQVALIQKTDSDVCFTAHKDDFGGNSLDLVPDLAYGETRYFPDSLDLVFKYNHHPMIQTMLAKKTLLIKLGMFDETLRVAEDTKLIYRIALYTGVSYINEPLFILNRKRETPGLSDDKSLKVAIERYECYYRVQSEAYWLLISRNMELAKIVKTNIGYFVSRRAEIHAAMRDFQLAKRFAREGLKYSSTMKTFLRCLVLSICPNLLHKYMSRKWNTGI